MDSTHADTQTRTLLTTPNLLMKTTWYNLKLEKKKKAKQNWNDFVGCFRCAILHSLDLLGGDGWSQWQPISVLLSNLIQSLLLRCFSCSLCCLCKPLCNLRCPYRAIFDLTCVYSCAQKFTYTHGHDNFGLFRYFFLFLFQGAMIV